MDHPKCKLCGVRHSMRDPHVWPKDVSHNGVANTEKAMANKGGGASGILSSTCDKVGGSASDSKTRTYKYRDREKRRQYMKNYMRELRASKAQQVGKKLVKKASSPHLEGVNG